MILRDCVFALSLHPHRLFLNSPSKCDRQKQVNALLEAYILSVIIEAQEGTSTDDTDSTGSGWNTDSDAPSDASVM